MSPLLSLVALCLAAPVGYMGLRVPRAAVGATVEATVELGFRSPRRSLPPESRTESRKRWALWLVSSSVVLAAPWGFPEVPVLRFFVAVCCVLWFMRLTETRLGKVPWVNLRSYEDYFWYFTFFGEVRPHPPAERVWGRQMGMKRMARGLSKGTCVFALLAVSTAFPWLWDSFVLRSVWCLLGGYFGATGAADFVSGLQMLVSGHGCAETFVIPLVARSPSDFWGRRWNLVFRNVSYRVLFQKIARRFGVATAGAGVFLWSILAHEYLVIAALGTTRGHMTAFFALQGVMTLVLSRRGKGQPWPTFVAVSAHWAWMVLTAPLFFEPVLQIFPARHWLLW